VFLLSIPDRWRLPFFLGATVGVAFVVAALTYVLVRFHQPAQDSKSANRLVGDKSRDFTH
jgi:hypothetical protein